MGFNPASVLGNVKVRQQQAFRQPTNNQYSQQEVVSPRLVYQYAISPNDNSNNGYILGVLDWYGEERHVKITMSDEAYQGQKARDEKATTSYENNFCGAYIDSKMAAKLKFIESNKDEKKMVLGLEGAIFKTNKVEKINNIEYMPVVVRRIINFKSMSKAIEGFFTASGYYVRDKEAYRVSSIESWSKNPIKFSDTENISKLESMLETLNQNRDKYDAGDKETDMLPNLGIKFIAIQEVKGKDKDGNENVIVSRKIFHTSSAMDLIQLESGVYKPLNSEFMHQMMEGYKEYVLSSENGVLSKLNIPAEEVVFAIVPFKAYTTSTIDGTFFMKPNDDNVKRRPLYQMIQTPYLNSLDEDETPTVGRNLAFTGFIKLTKNKVNEETGRVTAQNIVTNVYFGNLKGNVLSFLRDGDDDMKYEIEETIRKRFYTEEQIREIEKRKEEKMLREGQTPQSSSLSKDVGLSAPEGLSLQSAQSAETHNTSLDADDLFGEPETSAQKVETAPSSSTVQSEPSLDDDMDDDIPF